MKSKTLGILMLALGLVIAGTADAASAKRRRAAASSSGEPRKAVYANIAGFAYGIPTIGYEHGLNGGNNAITGNLGFRQIGLGGANDNFTIIGASSAYRWYFQPMTGPQTGWFAGPKLQLYSMTFNYEVTTVTFPGPVYGKRKESVGGIFYGLGGEGGYQWIFDGGFYAHAGLELGYFGGGVSAAAGAPTLTFGGAFSGALASLGYAF